MPSECSASATKAGALAGRRCLRSGNADRRDLRPPPTISACELSSRSRVRSASSASGSARSVFDRIRRSARITCLRDFRRPADGVEAGRGIDHRHDHLDEEFAAERAVGRERLQDRRRVGEPAGLDDDAHERRNLAALAIDHELAQRILQVGAGDAADAAVAEQRGLVGCEPRISASSMPTAPYSLTMTAVPRPSGVARKCRSSVVLPAPRKPVRTVTGMRPPRACFRPPSERARASREGKSSKSPCQKSISRM